MKRKFPQAVVMPLPDDCELEVLRDELGLLDYNVSEIRDYGKQMPYRFIRNLIMTGNLENV